MDATLEFMITREEKRCKVTVESDSGKRKGFFGLDPSIESRIYEIQEAIERQRPLDEEFVEKLGIELFKMLFSECKDLLHTYLDQSDHLGIVLNVKDPFLSRIPWELCYDPEYKIFLGADSQCSLARRDQRSTQQFGRIDYPLKVLVVISSPMDLEKKRKYSLDPDESVELMKPLKDLEDRGLIIIDFLERASVKHIQEKLKEGYDIVHFIGHGFYDDETGKGYLVIEDKNRNAKNLEGRGVAQLFGVNPPQLVILTACESSPLIPFLLSRKIPAVLAMQYAVFKSVAHEFVERFYSLLVKGDSLIQAVCTARSAVQLEEGVGCTGWFTPILYVRADNILKIDTESPVVLPEKKTHRHDMVTDLLGVENFVGRRKDLWRIEKALLEDNLKMVVITGIGGIGKTALASKFVKRHKDKFRGVLARKIVNPGIGVEGILQLLNKFLMENGDQRIHEVIGEADLNMKLERLNYCLEDKYLIVLENFEILLEGEKIADENVEAFLRAFLSGFHSSKLIITSRYQFTFRDERAEGLMKYVDLEELSLQEAVQLLEKLGVRNHGMRRWIYKRIGGNPQFLELFVRLAKTRSAERLLKDAAPVREKIGAWLLRGLIELLTEEEQTALKKMSAFRSRVDRSISDVLELSDEVVDKLVYYSLMKVDEYGHYFVDQGVKGYVYALLSDKEKVEAHVQAARYYEVNFSREKGDISDILEWHYHLFESEQYEKAGELATGLVESFSRWGYWRTLMMLLTKTVDTTEGKTKAAALHSLGIVFQSFAEYEKAEKLYKESREISKSLKDEEGIARSHYHLGVIHQLRGEHEEAERLYRESLDIARSLNDRLGIARSLHQLGIIHEERGEYEEAEKLYRESLAISESLGDKQGIGASLHQLGGIHQIRGDDEEAEKLYRESLTIAVNLGDKQGIARSLHQLGIIHEEQGEYEEAERLYRESLDIKKSLKDKQGIAASLRHLGTVCMEQGKQEHALKNYIDSLTIFLQVSSSDAGVVIKNLQDMRQAIGEERFDNYWKTTTGQEIPAYMKISYDQLEDLINYILQVSKTRKGEEIAQVTEAIKGLSREGEPDVDDLLRILLDYLAGRNISHEIEELEEPFKSLLKKYIKWTQ